MAAKKRLRSCQYRKGNRVLVKKGYRLKKGKDGKTRCVKGAEARARSRSRRRRVAAGKGRLKYDCQTVDKQTGRVRVKKGFYIRGGKCIRAKGAKAPSARAPSAKAKSASKAVPKLSTFEDQFEAFMKRSTKPSSKAQVKIRSDLKRYYEMMPAKMKQRMEREAAKAAQAKAKSSSTPKPRSGSRSEAEAYARKFLPRIGR